MARRLVLCAILLTALCAAHAATMVTTFPSSFTGILGGPTSIEEFSIPLSQAGALSFQTFGFGGGINAAGATIVPGGFAPQLAWYDPLGNLIDYTSAITTPSNSGCPPAGTVTIGTEIDCGDVHVSLAAGPGIYTLVLADAGNNPAGTTLADGFLSDYDMWLGYVDNNGDPAFGICDVTSGTTCIPRSAAWALDINFTPGTPQPVPEPATLCLVGSGLALAWWRKRAAR